MRWMWVAFELVRWGWCWDWSLLWVIGCFVVSWKTLISCGSVKGGEEISGIRWVWAQGDGWKRVLCYLSKWPTNFRSFRGMALLLLWLACLSFYNGVLVKHWLARIQNAWLIRGDEIKVLSFLRLLVRSRKIHFEGLSCFFG